MSGMHWRGRKKGKLAVPRNWALQSRPPQQRLPQFNLHSSPSCTRLPLHAKQKIWFFSEICFNWTLTLGGKHNIIIITIYNYYYYLILNTAGKRSLQQYDLLASQYIRAGQNLKGYFEGGDYLSCFKLLFPAHYLVGSQRSFSHGKFPQGNSQDLLFISDN